MILDTILEQKNRDVEFLRAQYEDWAPPASPPVRRDFREALLQPGISLIAEFKRRSPSRGEIRPGAQPIGVAQTYLGAGAAALSVLTDGMFFGGSMDDLVAARAAAELPVLRKDFVIDEVQLAASCVPEGPDAVLLIASVLDAQRLRELRECAARCGQAALVEVHNEAELAVALESGADIIGINNRDLQTFEVSLDTTIALRPQVPQGIPVVAESGIHTADDVRCLADAGVDAMLVGEALMSADDPAAKIKELLSAT
ncbi:MAG: indole-3-glycerol phosphate synthase TrpC [Armatimonadetes bacterium]|nr:indole-3-glycerol phosphate synthase TrpC [Armatimonadota bacterium]